MKKLGIMLYIFGVTLFILGKETYAYLDPSAMTYLIQVTAAIVITIGSVIGIFFYKIKRFLKNKFKKSENETKIDEKSE